MQNDSESLLILQLITHPTANYTQTVELGGTQNSVVCIVCSYRMGGSGFESQQEQNIFVSLELSRLAVVPIQPPFRMIWGFFSGVKQMGHEVDHSPPSYAKIMYLHSPYTCCVMYWENFAFLFLTVELGLLSVLIM